MNLPALLLALALSLPLAAWVLTLASPPRPAPSTLTCAPFCEVVVEPVGAHRLRATCVCGSSR